MLWYPATKLSPTKLSSTKLSATKLSSIKLSPTKLSSTKLSSTKLSSTKLSSIKLSSTKLSSINYRLQNYLLQNYRLQNYQLQKLLCITVLFFLPWRNSPSVVQGLLIIVDSRSHSDTPHAVGLLWTSDQPDAETSIWQNTKLTTDSHASGGIQTRNTSSWAATDPRLRPRGHLDWLWLNVTH